MKKVLLLTTLVLAAFTLVACGDDKVELPELFGMDRFEIHDKLEDKGLDVYIWVNEDIRYPSPNQFLEYRDHTTGDKVERGTLINVVVSSSLDDDEEEFEPAPRTPMDVDGSFTTPEDVALYVDTFGELPSNFITEEEAMDLGYDPDEENLWDVTDEKSIGGDEFDPDGHDALPNGEDRTYFTADLNFEGGSRPDERLVYSDDGLVFYTDDLYGSFEQLFGTPEHPPLDPDEHYTRRDDVALYIRTFGKLPPNYFIRYENDLNLYERTYGYLPDRYDDFDLFNQLTELRREYGEDSYYGYWHFSNHAGQLPDFTMFYIADTNIGGAGHSRGNDRFVFSPEERIVYYTPDHFETYELWYGDARD